MSRIAEALRFIDDAESAGADARDIVKGLVEHHGAKRTYPSYRTAVRCCGVSFEAATCCELATAKLIVRGLARKLRERGGS